MNVDDNEETIKKYIIRWMDNGFCSFSIFFQRKNSSMQLREKSNQIKLVKPNEAIMMKI